MLGCHLNFLSGVFSKEAGGCHKDSGKYTGPSGVLYECFLKHRNISNSGVTASQQNVLRMLIMTCILQPAPDFFLTSCMNAILMGAGVFL